MRFIEFPVSINYKQSAKLINFSYLSGLLILMFSGTACSDNQGSELYPETHIIIM